MWISDFAIRRPIITITAMLALVAFGLAALANLQVDEFPDLDQPVVMVQIAYPGASPDAVERELVEPIEEAIFALSGVERGKTTSNAVDGFAQFVITFAFTKPVAEASQDVRDAISTIRGDLPTEIEEPVITRFDWSDQPIVSLTVSSNTVDPRGLTTITDPGIVSSLRSVPGVAQASVVGASYPEMTVQLRPDAMQAAGVGIEEIARAVGTQNLAAPVGRLNGAQEERAIRLKGRIEGPDGFRQLVVAQRGGAIIRLGDVADVFAGVEESRTASSYNGVRAVGINIIKAKGYSTNEVVFKLRDEIARLQATMPQGTKLTIVKDAGIRVTGSVNHVKTTLLEGAALTILVVFLFLNSWRSTVITGLALPVSVLAGFIGVWAFGFTLNSMSLLGLSLAIGILIDDAIVVRENIVRHVGMGKDHYTAAQEGTAEIGLAVAATTFSIIAVFVPIAFVTGQSGQWLKPFALSISGAVVASLFVSFSLDPMLSAYWPDPHREEHEKSWLTKLLDRFDRWFQRMTDRYARVVAWALDHRWSMVGLALASFAGAIMLQGAYGGAGFVPLSDRAEIEVIVEAPASSNLEYTMERTEAVAAIARRHPEVLYTYVSAGTPLPMRTPGVDQSHIYMKLSPAADRKISASELGVQLRKEMQAVGGVNVSVFSGGFGGAFKELQLQLRGPDAGTLAQLGEEVLAVARTVPGAVDVSLSARGPRDELTVEVDRSLAGALGLTVGQVGQAMRVAFAGIDAGDWVDASGKTRDVRLRLAPEARQRAVDLERLPLTVFGTDGSAHVVPLGQVARIGTDRAPAQVDHLDRSRVITLEANTDGRPLSEVTAAMKEKISAITFPPGYVMTEGGWNQEQNDTFTSIFTALGIAVLLMYLILVVQFGSFLDPIAILISLPLSLIGVVIALIVTGDTLNIMSLMGVMLLMGIVAKNSILLIDFAKWAREERGVPVREALIEAGRIRLRPILMTTFALIAGMLPVSIGGTEGADFYAPIGRAVIGGVITSTFLTLLVIPTFYEIIDGLRERSLAFAGRWRTKNGERRTENGERMAESG
ncbi:MAG: efflux RND transporter permease subunit [Gemmatimonadales bacterium]|nr:efflux RND transporter permease subunit [Gemmatimonadales bacterium]